LKPFRWSPHALTDREIPRVEAEQALSSPEVVVPARPNRQFFMHRYFDARFKQEMLVRALVEEAPQERVVITVYITSKVDKSMKKGRT
jgi:hypothetical protein